MKNQIINLLKEGRSYKEIINLCGCSKATISYHAKNIGLGKGIPTKFQDWDSFQRSYNSGLTVAECCSLYDVSPSTVTKTVKEGKLTLRPKSKQPEEILIANSKTTRKVVKSHVLRNGILKNICSQCGQGDSWNGKPLIMVLDHINGINNDHRLENLRMLCPNCNSQTDTFSGRNLKQK